MKCTKIVIVLFLYQGICHGMEQHAQGSPHSTPRKVTFEPVLAAATRAAATEPANDEEFKKELMEFVVATKGEGLLIPAIQHGNDKLALDLIARGADVSTPACTGVTPIYAAAQHNRPNILGNLLRFGALTNVTPCPLYVAVENGHIDCLTELLIAPCDLNRRYRLLTGQTHSLLTLVVEKNRPKMIPLLIASGADPNKEPLALLYAIEQRRSSCLQSLIEGGAQVNSKLNYKKREYPNKCGYYFSFETPLSLAIAEEDLDLTRILLQGGASADEPLQGEVCETSEPAMWFMCKIGFGPPPGVTALTLARRTGNVSLSKLVAQYSSIKNITTEIQKAQYRDQKRTFEQLTKIKEEKIGPMRAK